MKKGLLKISKWLGVLFLAYWLVFGLIVPTILPSLLPKYLSSSFNINIALKKVNFNPFSFSLNIKDLIIYDRFGATASRVDSLDLNIDPTTLVKKDLFVPYVALNNPRLFITIDREKRLNLTNIFPTSKESSTGDENVSLPFDISFGRAFVENGKVSYTDASTQEIFHVNFENLNYKIENISTRKNVVGSQEFNSMGSLLKTLKWEGEISLSPFKIQGEVKLKDALLEPWFSYLAPKSDYALKRSKAWLNLSYNIFLENSNLCVEIKKPEVKILNSNLLQENRDLLSLDSLNFRAKALRLETNKNFSLNLSDAKLDLNGLKIIQPLEMSFLATLSALSVDGINVNLKNSDYNLSLAKTTLKDGSFYEKKVTPFASFDKIILSEALLTKDELNTKQVDLSSPKIHLNLDENYNLDVFSFFTPNISKEKNNKQSKIKNNKNLNPFLLKIDKLNLKDMSANINTPSQNHLVKDLSLHLANISNDLKKEIPYEVLGKIDEAPLFSKGVIAPNPFYLNASFELNHPNLEHYNSYLKSYFLGFLRQGTLHIKGNLKGSSTKDINLKSDLKLQEIVIEDEKNKPLLKLGSLDIKSVDFDQKNLKLSNISIKEPYANIHIYKSMETNIGSLFPKNKKTPSKKASMKKESPFHLVLEKMELKKGSMGFRDDSLPLPFSVNAKNLNGSFSLLDTKSNKPSNLRIEGEVGEHGYTRIQGEILPMKPTEDLKLNVLFKHIDLTNLTPYSGKFVGYAVKDGYLDLDLGYTIKKKTLLGENSIILRNLTLGERIESEDAVNLPLNLAIALLKDSQGKIDVNLPVKGDLNDPKFSYGGIIWKAFTNLITGIVTSPFKFLGNLLGMDGEALSSITFEPGFAILLPPEQAKITQYIKILSSRPELKLEISSVYDPKIDLRALQTRALSVILKDEENSSYEESLESLYTERFSKEELNELQKTYTKDKKLNNSAFYQAIFETLINTQKVATKELEDLALKRSKLIYEALIEAGALKDDLSIQAVRQIDSKKSNWIESPIEVSQ